MPRKNKGLKIKLSDIADVGSKAGLPFAGPARDILKMFNLAQSGGTRRIAGPKKGKFKKNLGNVAPVSSIVSKAGIGVQVPMSVPKTYQRSRAAVNRKDGVTINACEGIDLSIAIASAQTFAIANNSLSPLNTTLFPWLSAQSALWTKFYFRKLKAYYIPAAATSDTKTFFEAFAPDVELASADDLTDILGMAQKQMSPAWQGHVFEVDLPQEGKEPYYIDADGADNRLEAQGNLMFGLAHGVEGTFTPGQLFFEYEVDLFDRKVSGLTLQAQKLQRALMNRQLDTEVRRKAGLAFVESVLKQRPALRQESQLEALKRDVDDILKSVVIPSAAIQLAPSVRR